MRFQGPPNSTETCAWRQVRNEKYDEKVDVYSFGVILWEMMSTDVPFSNLTDMQAAMNTSNGMRPVVPSNVPEPVKKLIKDCWVHEPDVRLASLQTSVYVCSSCATHSSCATA
jgi:serine/threonine protein kinase